MSATNMLPPGRYYVGDLCYVVPDDEWMDFVNRSFPNWDAMVNGVLETNDGINYAIFSTKYGDGAFCDNFGSTYFVDSGSIGCIPLCALPTDLDLDRARRLGNIVDFDEAFEVGYEDVTGIITFGNVRILTEFGDEEDDNDDDDDYIGYGEPEDAEAYDNCN